MRFNFDIANVLGAVYHRGTIKFGPDGSLLYSPIGNKVAVYDLKANKSQALPLQFHYNIDKIAIHPKSTIALLASEKSHLYIVSLMTGRQLHMKEYKKFSKISHLSFSPDSRFYCVCGGNLALIYITSGTIVEGKKREITPFKLLRKFKVHYENISSVTWTSDSNYICFGSEDMSLSLYNIVDNTQPFIHLRGHNDSVISCFFANSFDSDKTLYSIAKNCQLVIWEQVLRDTDNEIEKEKEEEDEKEEGPPKKKAYNKMRFKLNKKVFLKPDKQSNCSITSADYSPATKLLVLGYNTGHYSLYEMPTASLIYEYHREFGSIDSISINLSGDWIALASNIDPHLDSNSSSNRTESSLIVWEWQSKSHVLNQVGSGVTMSNLHECVDFSPDGNSVVSGNYSGRLKVWDCITGDTTALFGLEHTGPIKSVKFAPNKSGKVIVSASLDGTIRAYDLQKLKNFRTFKSSIPDRNPEFICMDVDMTGEFIAAGTYNYFEIYLFSLKTGKFLEYLTGHEGPVSGVNFSSSSNILISSSWDKTVRIWNLFEQAKVAREIITLNHEVITIAIRPDGNQFAASTSNGQIAIFNAHNSEQIGAPIEGVSDLGTSQEISDMFRDSKKYFVTLNYSADGNHILAAGRSNNICIYNVDQKILVKKIAMTFNRSMDGIFDYISNRRRAEFGFNLELLEERSENDSIKLPGVRKGDYGERKAMPIVAAYQIKFCPTMRSFVSATTEGVLIYSLDRNQVFDPYKLKINVDPGTVRQELKKKNYELALSHSIQLNSNELFIEIFESIPIESMDLIIAGLSAEYSEKLLEMIAKNFLKTTHLEYYLEWIQKILYNKGVAMKANNLSLRQLQQVLTNIYGNIKKNCDYSRYSLSYLTRLCIQDNIEIKSQ